MPHTSKFLKSKIRTIPDYPKKGIQFRDITSLLADAEGLRRCVEKMSEPYKEQGITKVVGMEARGFILGSAVAVELNVGFVPARKPGKLPGQTISQSYELEYGTDTLEIHKDALSAEDKVLIVDDLIATGGTAAAAIKLCRQSGATVEHAVFAIALPDLPGLNTLKMLDIIPHSLVDFGGH